VANVSRAERPVARRHGWAPERFLTYVERTIARRPGRTRRRQLEVTAGNALFAIERLIGRWRPFVCMGLIVVCRETGGAQRDGGTSG